MTILLGLYASMEFTARTIYRTNITVLRMTDRWKRAAPEIEILFMGNSHMAAIDCRYIGIPCFNASIGAQDLVLTGKTFAQMLNHEPKLKFLVIELSYISFGLDTDVAAPEMMANYAKVFGIWPERGNYLRMLLWHSAFFSHRNFFFQDLWSRMIMRNVPVPAREDIAKGGSTLGRAHSAYAKALTRNLEALHSTLELAEGRGIQVILITAPVTSYFWQAYDEQAKKIFYDNVRGILERHRKAIYFDFSRWRDLVDSDWGDPGHLSNSGSRKFTTLFNNICSSHTPPLHNPHQ